jgi:recombinational DNA repair ATPase RecF
MQRIKSITLRNFKFFYGNETKQPQNKLELNQNHLLLYGENGSGKSSIYWGLYTFLQSSLKTDSQIEKYFLPNHPENLRNRFARDADDSGIVIEFIDEHGTITKEISNRTRNTISDSTVLKINAGSDFLNYKYLSKLYDFRNSEEINLFDWFEREILMFIDFEEGYTDHHGTISSSTLASDWWNFVSSAPALLPRNGNVVSVSSPEYVRLKTQTIPKFIELLKSFLHRITQKANQILIDEFEEKFSIDFNVESIECDYNKYVSQRAKDGLLHRPKIPLKVVFDHSKLRVSSKGIDKPHTFLNEARLTAIALAIRLAMLDQRPLLPNTARLLVLDDLLLSLDMSHRDKVLDIILTFVDDYQLIILSHDRAFYNLCKNRIKNRIKDSDEFKWEFKEMFQSETKLNIPCPFIPDKKDYLDLAKKYLHEFDYPASANYLRKECERVISTILPKNMLYKDDLDSGSAKLLLDGLIGKLKTYCKEIGMDYSPFEKLKEHKDILMNPLSHDNIESPIYKSELLNSIELIVKLNQLEIKTIGLADANNEISFVLMETDKDGNVWEYTFYLKENFRAIKDLTGVWHISNPECEFQKRKNITLSLNEESLDSIQKLKKGYDQIRHRLGINVEGSIPKDLKSIIKINGDLILT